MTIVIKNFHIVTSLLLSRKQGELTSAVVFLSVFSQPIVSRAKPEMLKSHFIPTMEKLKKRTSKVVAEEDHLRMEGKSEGDEEDGTIRDEFAVLCRDLYALYPLLIRYVDNNRYESSDDSLTPLTVSIIQRVPKIICPVAERGG